MKLGDINLPHRNTPNSLRSSSLAYMRRGDGTLLTMASQSLMNLNTYGIGNYELCGNATRPEFRKTPVFFLTEMDFLNSAGTVISYALCI